MDSATAATFRIWGVDNVIYGPVELPVLVGWIKEERVMANTWVFAEHESLWRKASEWSELAMFFKDKTASPAAAMITGGPGRLDYGSAARTGAASRRTTGSEVPP